MPRPQLSFHAEWQGGQARLSMAGEIDLLTAPVLVEEAGEQLGRSPSALVLDLSQVTFCDSAGVAALVRIYHRATGAGIELTLRGATGMVRHVLEISGVDQVVTVEDERARQGD
jgi:anti-sigma B factor antagonist